MSTSSTSVRFTSADLESLPDRIDGTRYEIIDGDLHVSKPTDLWHQYASGQIVVALRNWDDQAMVGSAVSAPGLIFGPHDDVAPDVVWVSRERLPHLLDAGGHLRAAPELVAEVLSPGAASERRDRELKLDLYSRQGVREYWIVDWQARTVQVFRREQAALHQGASAERSGKAQPRPAQGAAAAGRPSAGRWARRRPPAGRAGRGARPGRTRSRG